MQRVIDRLDRTEKIKSLPRYRDIRGVGQPVPERFLRRQEKCARAEHLLEDRPVRRRLVQEEDRGSLARFHSQSRDGREAGDEPEEFREVLDFRRPQRYQASVRQGFEPGRFRVFSGLRVLLGQDREVQLFLE